MAVIKLQRRENQNAGDSFCPTGLLPPFSALAPTALILSSTIRMARTLSLVDMKQLHDFSAAFAVPNSVLVIWLARAQGKNRVANEVKTIVNVGFRESLLI